MGGGREEKRMSILNKMLKLRKLGSRCCVHFLLYTQHKELQYIVLMSHSSSVKDLLKALPCVMLLSPEPWHPSSSSQSPLDSISSFIPFPLPLSLIVHLSDLKCFLSVASYKGNNDVGVDDSGNNCNIFLHLKNEKMLSFSNSLEATVLQFHVSLLKAA